MVADCLLPSPWSPQEDHSKAKRHNVQSPLIYNLPTPATFKSLSLADEGNAALSPLGAAQSVHAPATQNSTWAKPRLGLQPAKCIDDIAVARNTPRPPTNPSVTSMGSPWGASMKASVLALPAIHVVPSLYVCRTQCPHAASLSAAPHDKSRRPAFVTSCAPLRCPK